MAMSAERPPSIDAGEHTKDDGYFGPASVTWRVSSHPANGMVGTAAASIQMLYPPVMHMIDQASSFQKNPDLRAQRTAAFGATVIFGDKESADRAGEVLRKIHRACVATNPRTGEEYHADEPELLLWVNNALLYAELRAQELYGPSLKPDERDEFVVEQKIMARMVGLDMEAVPSTVAEVDEYMTSMLPKLGFGLDTKWFKELVLPHGIALAPGDAIKQLFGWGAVAVMAPEHRALFGIRWNRLRELAILSSVRALIAPLASKPIEQSLPQIRQFVDENAFGARKRKVADALESHASVA
jgi:uncharacterized protein (DUF2236 family)